MLTSIHSGFLPIILEHAIGVDSTHIRLGGKPLPCIQVDGVVWTIVE